MPGAPSIRSQPHLMASLRDADSLAIHAPVVSLVPRSTTGYLMASLRDIYPSSKPEASNGSPSGSRRREQHKNRRRQRLIFKSTINNRHSVLYLPGALARKFRRAAESTKTRIQIPLCDLSAFCGSIISPTHQAPSTKHQAPSTKHQAQRTQRTQRTLNPHQSPYLPVFMI